MDYRKRTGIFFAVIGLAGSVPGTVLATDTVLVGPSAVQQQPSAQAVSPLDDAAEERVQTLLASMSKEEKAGQMLMVSPSQLSKGDWTQYQEEVLANITFYKIGSIVFLAEDLEHADAVEALKEALADREGIQVLVAEDEEGSLSGGFCSLESGGVLTLDASQAQDGLVLVSESLTKLEAEQDVGTGVTVTKALQAGNDMIALPADVMTAYFSITSAMDEQLVTMEQVDASVQKILEAKARLGLL